LAVFSGNEFAVDMVLAKELQLNNKNKCKFVDAEDINKRTPLFYASLKLKLSSLIKSGANPLSKDIRGLTVTPKSRYQQIIK
jgi:hypothetical protein